MWRHIAEAYSNDALNISTPQMESVTYLEQEIAAPASLWMQLLLQALKVLLQNFCIPLKFETADTGEERVSQKFPAKCLYYFLWYCPYCWMCTEPTCCHNGIFDHEFPVDLSHQLY
jgi:hypothetical protein